MGTGTDAKLQATEVGVEAAVRARYERAARKTEDLLCSPVEYEEEYLKAIPKEILERDYGCGDPSRFARPGDAVLDLGSGGGKICYILSQKVGATGRVIGVDSNDEMLGLARRHRGNVAKKIGYSNVEFRKARIQDLKLDYELLDEHLSRHPVENSRDLLKVEALTDELRTMSPLIPDNSVDLVVSNCVLNLVRDEDKHQLIHEMYRVLRKGGRIAISDIVSDEDIPDHMKRDPELWSGCVSGAFREDLFLKTLEDAKFYGITLERWESKPYRTVEGIEFRSVTLQAVKGKEGPCIERNQAVIYKGPWKKVSDDDGHLLERGRRMAVCEKTFGIYSKAPYRDDFIFLEPFEPTPEEEAKPFDCRRVAFRHPRETKGQEYNVTESSGEACCAPGESCG